MSIGGSRRSFLSGASCARDLPIRPQQGMPGMQASLTQSLATYSPPAGMRLSRLWTRHPIR